MVTSSDDPREWRRATPWLLRRVNQRYRAAVAARLAEEELDGLARPGYWLLMALAAGATDAAGLVGPMGVTKQAVSKTVDSLVSGGFVLRRANEADRRRTDLVLTSKGMKTVEVIRAALAEAERGFLGEVGAPAWETTVATLRTLAEVRTHAGTPTSTQTDMQTVARTATGKKGA